jgi:anti-anti-sigma factor
LKLSIAVASGTPLIKIEGDIDPDDAPALERAAWEAFGSDGNQIILDLGPCTYMSSSGLGVLFSLVRWVRPKGGTVIALRPSANILQLLRLVRLTDERGFRVFADLESANEIILPAE